MAFLRYAAARVVQSRTSLNEGWDRVRTASVVHNGRDLVGQASKILQEEFNPKNYLLTHATIVASVDTYAVPKAKLGAVTEDGKKIVRKTTSYRIKPDCDQYINNNLDSWARPVLLKSYGTFVGGHNFLEHVQKEELSKGRILDAVARDIGNSVYVDILIATARKHGELVREIESGALKTLSMGCSIDGSTCTQCGHWAADETEMCEHVRYMKGNVFYDDQGQRHRVAELCGDESLDPTGGVHFIEASWVRVPAFEGAELRNVIEISSQRDSQRAAAMIEQALTQNVPFPSDFAQLRAASLRRGGEDGALFGEEPAEPPADAKPAETDALISLTEEISNHVLDRVRRNLKEKIDRDQLSADLLPAGSATAPNDTLVKQAAARTYRAALADVVATAKAPAELMQRVARLNSAARVFVPGTLYRAALQVGATSCHTSLAAYLESCRAVLGRAPTTAEAKTLIRLSSLLSAQKSASSRKTP